MNIFIDGIIYNLQKRGGISRYFTECLNRISNNSNIKIKLWLGNNLQGKLPQGKNIEIIYKNNIPILRPNKIFKPLINPINIYKENKYWGNCKNGIFHSTYFSTYKTIKIPQILTIHDMTYEKLPLFFNKRIDKDFIIKKKKCIDAADAIICVSENTKKDVIELYNIDANKIYVVYLGVSEEFKKTIDEKKNNDIKIRMPFLLYVGSRVHYKNFTNFIKAYHLLNASELKIITVGGGPYDPQEIELFKNLNISHKIINLGFISDKKLNVLYNSALCFVSPSFYEGFGITLLEAMACGTPITASNTSSLPEVAGNAALYFNPDDPADIADKIKQTITEGRASKRIVCGHERIKQFSWDKTADETLKIYKKYG